MRGAIHDITIRKPKGVSRDSEGRWATDDRYVRVRGKALHQAVTDRPRGEVGRSVLTLVRVPPGTEVASKDQVQVAGAGTHIDGVYRVDSLSVRARYLELTCALETQ